MEKSAKSVSEILSATRNLLADPKAWIKGDYAEGERGSVDPRAKRATCWCLSGAIEREAGSRRSAPWRESLFAVARSAKMSTGGENAGIAEANIAHFNDLPSTTHADVLAVLDRAIDLAKAEEAP